MKRRTTRLLLALLALYMSLTLLPGVAWASVDDGQVDLKPASELKWIDRVELPDYALTLYKTLEEAADGDGYKDYLIEDEYYDLEGDNIRTDMPGEFMRGTVTSSDGSTTRYTAILVTTTETKETDQNTKDYIANCIRTVMSAFWRDHSEVFWINGVYRIEFNRNGRRYYCLALCANHSKPDVGNASYYEIRREDFRPDGKWDIRSAMAQQDADIETILRTIPTGADRLTQIYYINDWLAENNGYNTDISSGTSDPWYATKSITALEGRKGVEGPDCGGYASAFKALCDALDIPCVNVHGIEASGGSHRWNYVQMEDGNWYAVDPNYNDNRKDRTRYLLVGAQTVVNGVKFVDNHIETNPAYYGGVESFMNGPVLNDEAYPRSVHLAYRGVSETLTPGDPVAMTPVLIFASDADYTYSSTPLPEGLTLNPDTGEITGTVTDDMDILTVIVTAANPNDPADTACCILQLE
ncbi:MAG: putative Ig domain-containing protein [Lachnospiraceae bacterium]|nr:putative Ig domain-containing protein [Lachnospiraceae bacterium]